MNVCGMVNSDLIHASPVEVSCEFCSYKFAKAKYCFTDPIDCKNDKITCKTLPT